MTKQPTNGELAIMLGHLKESIDELHKKADYTNGQVRLNTEYRVKQEAVISTGKWLIGVFGLGSVATFIKIFFY